MNYECQAFVKHVKDVRLLLLVGYKRQVWSYKSMKVLRPQFYCPAHVVYPPAVKLLKKTSTCITMPPSKFSCHFKSDP